MSTRYKFEAGSMETLNATLGGTSLIRHIVEEQGADAYEKSILCLGQLKTLFGEPLYTTEDLENQYSYCIIATDEAGKKLYLHAYSGPSGPAIGGSHEEDSSQAADELARLITKAAVTDYDYEGYYMDGACAVKMGVRNGVPYAEGRELSEEEFALQCKELYGIGE